MGCVWLHHGQMLQICPQKEMTDPSINITNGSSTYAFCYKTCKLMLSGLDGMNV